MSKMVYLDRVYGFFEQNVKNSHLSEPSFSPAIYAKIL